MLIMKHLLKKITPIELLNIARNHISNKQVSRLKSAKFDAKNLRGSRDFDLKSTLANSNDDKLWSADHNAIKALYGGDDIMGGVNPGDRKALYYIIMGLAPQSVLEVGTHIGASTLHIAKALKRGAGKTFITTVDIADVNHPDHGAWKKLELSDSPNGFAKQLNCSDIIEFHTGPCLDFMQGTNNKYDLIFLDGDHTAASVYKEVHAALTILNPGGFILLHDYYPGGKALFPDKNVIYGPYMAMERIKADNPSIEVLPLGQLPWPTKQGSCNTSLALVLKKQDGLES